MSTTEPRLKFGGHVPRAIVALLLGLSFPVSWRWMMLSIQGGAYYRYHQMAGGEVGGAGTKETMSPKTQNKGNFFVPTCSVFLAYVWALGDALTLSDHRNRL